MGLVSLKHQEIPPFRNGHRILIRLVAGASVLPPPVEEKGLKFENDILALTKVIAP